MYVIKHIPEDFVVDEVSSVKPGEGDFLYVRLKKRCLNTLEALQRVASALGIDVKRVSCAGNKDRRAVTTQVCGIKNVGEDKIRALSLKDVELDVLGRGDHPVRLGELEGNCFRITVRNLDRIPGINPRFRNLFGVQRFSVGNAEVGRLLVKRDWGAAVRLLSGLNPELRDGFAGFSNDFIGALRMVPLKTLKFYVHAFQSLLWNRMAESSVEEVLPIPGFGTDDELSKRVLAAEGLVPRDFVFREFPEISAEGGSRLVFVEARDLKVVVGDDEFFHSKKKLVLEFFLPKGAYATEFIRQNLGPS